MKKILVVLLLILSLSGCSNTNNISMGGSSSVHPLADVIKDDYSAEFPNQTISYDGPGSSKGVEGIKTGIYQFGFLSRNLKANEQDPRMKSEIIALDGIAVIVNNANPINNLSVTQLQDIYSGKITNWKEVGGNDQEISLVARDNASGTRSAFDDIIGIKSVSENALLYDSNGAVTQAVEHNINSIGYISFDTLNRNQNVIKAIDVNNITPSAKNIQSNQYQLYRPFIMVYYPDQLTKQSQEFLSWFDANKQRLVTEADFVTPGGSNESTTTR